MFWIILSAGIFAVIAYGFMTSSNETHQEDTKSGPAHKASPLIDDDPEFTPTWHTREFEYGQDRKKLGLTLLPGFNDISLVGVNSFQENCANFIGKADQKRAVVELKRETNNPYDPNAVAVFGAVQPGAKMMQLGYLPAPKAKEIAETFLETLPLHGELRKGGVHRDDDAVFIAINVVSPPAAERNKHKRQIG